MNRIKKSVAAALLVMVGVFGASAVAAPASATPDHAGAKTSVEPQIHGVW